MALKTFTKTSFTTCMQAFYEEIKHTQETGAPEVVLYLYGEKSIKFNPQKFLKVNKNSIIVGEDKVEIKFKDIRGLDFYFQNDKKLEPKDPKEKPLPKIDFTQYMNDRVAKMKESKSTEKDAVMQQYQNLLNSLWAK